MSTALESMKRKNRLYVLISRARTITSHRRGQLNVFATIVGLNEARWLNELIFADFTSQIGYQYAIPCLPLPTGASAEEDQVLQSLNQMVVTICLDIMFYKQKRRKKNDKKDSTPNPRARSQSKACAKLI